VDTSSKDVQDVFPDQKPIDRTTLNTWEDEHVVNAVKKIGRKKLVIAAALDGDMPRVSGAECTRG